MLPVLGSPLLHTEERKNKFEAPYYKGRGGPGVDFEHLSRCGGLDVDTWDLLK